MSGRGKGTFDREGNFCLYTNLIDHRGRKGISVVVADLELQGQFASRVEWERCLIPPKMHIVQGSKKAA